MEHEPVQHGDAILRVGLARKSHVCEPSMVLLAIWIRGHLDIDDVPALAQDCPNLFARRFKRDVSDVDFGGLHRRQIKTSSGENGGFEGSHVKVNQCLDDQKHSEVTDCKYSNTYHTWGPVKWAYLY